MSNIYERVDNGDGTYSQNSHLTGSDIIQQVDLQYRRQKTIQTHAGVSVLPGQVANSVWIDTDGYSQLAGTLTSDGATTNNVTLSWSNDGTNIHGVENLIVNGASMQRAGIVDTKARFVRVGLYNGDTVAHVMNGWVYPKV